MSFLAPLFLLGTLAIGLPVLFHMVRQSTRERVVFSTLMFLSPAPPRLTRRSRIEHWLLLLLRALIVALLAFAFSRPFFPAADFSSGSEAAPRQRLILLDVSASMRHPDVWEEAQSKVRTLLQEASVGDQIALMTFARSMDTVVSLEEWNEWGIEERVPLTLARLEGVQPGWEGTRLGDTLMDAAEWLLQLPPSTDTSVTPQRQIEVVSDMQQGARHEVLANFDWPSEILVDLHRMQRPAGANAGIHWIPELASEQSAAVSPSRVRIQNAAHSTSELFQVGWSMDEQATLSDDSTTAEATFHGPAVDAYVPPGQSRIITLPEAPDGVQATSVLLKGDDDSFDNRSHRVPPVQVVSMLHYFGASQAAADDPTHPAFFLQRALPSSRHQAMEMRFHEPDIAPVDMEFTADKSGRDVFLVAGALPASTTRQLHSMVVEGRSVIVLLTDASPAMARTLSGLLGLSVEDPDATTGLRIEEINPPRYALLGELDFSHPLLVPFADPRYSDFTKIHIWKHRRIRPDAIPNSHVVAWFDSRDPAILDVSVGTGRLILFTTGWQPADSQLALSTKFVPLVHSMLDLSGTLMSKPPSPIVGDSLIPEALGWPSSIAATVRFPDGSNHPFNASPSSSVSVEGATARLSYPMPGIYTIESVPSELRQPVQIAVQLDPAETRTEPLPVDALEPFGILSTAQAVAREAGAQAAQVQRQAAETEKRQKVWRWALAAALAGLLLESWFAGWSARRPASAQSQATTETPATA